MGEGVREGERVIEREVVIDAVGEREMDEVGVLEREAEEERLTDAVTDGVRDDE